SIRYEGSYKNDKKHGHGTYYWSVGRQYVREWADDVRNQQGVYTSANGNQYEGSWKNHKKHGHVTQYLANGSIEQGEWTNDTCN
ncbi:unnamed protein product, partial [Didymodactylos carnosus]